MERAFAVCWWCDDSVDEEEHYWTIHGAIDQEQLSPGDPVSIYDDGLVYATEGEAMRMLATFENKDPTDGTQLDVFPVEKQAHGGWDIIEDGR